MEISGISNLSNNSFILANLNNNNFFQFEDRFRDIKEIKDAPIQVQSIKEDLTVMKSKCDEVMRDNELLNHQLETKIQINNVQIQTANELEAYMRSSGVPIYNGMTTDEIKQKFHSLNADEESKSMIVKFEERVEYHDVVPYKGQVPFKGQSACNVGCCSGCSGGCVTKQFWIHTGSSCFYENNVWGNYYCGKCGNYFSSGHKQYGNTNCVSRTYWTCSCGYNQNIWSNWYCGKCGGYYPGNRPNYSANLCNHNHANHNHNHGCSTISGMQDYSGEVVHKGFQDISKEKTVVCKYEHHKCPCDKIALLIYSLRESLGQKEYYKKFSEQIKTFNLKTINYVQDISKRLEKITPKIENVNEKINLSISTVESDRDFFINKWKNQEKINQISMELMNRENEKLDNVQNGFNKQLQDKEEANQKEKEKLKKKKEEKEERLRVLEEKRREEIEKMNKIIQDKENEINSLKNQILLNELDMKREKDVLKNNMDKTKQDLSNEFKDKEFIHIAEIKEFKNAVKDFIPRFFLRLCKVTNVKEDDLAKYEKGFLSEDVTEKEIIRKVRMWVNYHNF